MMNFLKHGWFYDTCIVRYIYIHTMLHIFHWENYRNGAFLTTCTIYSNIVIKNICIKKYINKIACVVTVSNIWLLPQLSALALDPSGARLVTGGYDYDVKFWDFAGMDSSLQSFRNIRPCEGLFVYFFIKFCFPHIQTKMICLSLIETKTNSTPNVIVLIDYVPCKVWYNRKWTIHDNACMHS